MAIIFSDNFNSGVLIGWGSPNTAYTTNYWGIGGSYCAVCWQGQSRKTFPTPLVSRGAIRAQIALIIDPNEPADSVEGLFFLSAQRSGVAGSGMQWLIYAKSNGQFVFRISDVFNGPVKWIYTATGLYPTDGTWFGLQVRFNFTTTFVSITVTVNNVDKATVTHNPTTAYNTNTWNDVWIYEWRQPNGVPIPTTLIAFDNYEVDDNDAVVDWPALAGPKLDLARTCSGFAPPPVSGVYMITASNLKHDKYYNKEVKIPNPTVKTAVLGE